MSSIPLETSYLSPHYEENQVYSFLINQGFTLLQRPKALVTILKGIFTHRLPQILNYDENRVFSSKGMMTADIFQSAREHLMMSGELSRDMLLCLWFHLKIDQNLLEELLDLMPRLDLCYTIPQPDIPPRRSEFFPMMVVPFYNRDPPPEDTSGLWPDDLEEDLKEVQLTLTFPLLYPNGLFERLSCRLQEKLSSRIDWRDLLLTEFFSGKMLIARELNPDTYDCVIKIRIRGQDTNFLKNTMAFVYRELGNLLGNCPGLVWYKLFSVKNCGDLGIADCFPREVLMSNWWKFPRKKEDNATREHNGIRLSEGSLLFLGNCPGMVSYKLFIVKTCGEQIVSLEKFWWASDGNFHKL